LSRKQYQRLKNEWCGVPEVFDRPDVIEERHRIDVDCRRTDRNHPLFSMTDPSTDAKADGEAVTTISPDLTDAGAQSPSNEHIDRLATILLTYNFYEKELGQNAFLFYFYF
jgi:TBC1 domain family member 15